MYGIFDETEFLKTKFSGLFQMQKKIKALDRFSTVGNFHHQNYLDLLKKCMQTDFLGDEENRFLDHMLKKYEIHYLDWCHKTKWLHQEMKRVKQLNTKKEPVIQQPKQADLFDFSINRSNFKIPLSILKQKVNLKSARI